MVQKYLNSIFYISVIDEGKAPGSARVMVVNNLYFLYGTVTPKDFS